MLTPQKYPKTPHLPFSPEVKDDDISLNEHHCSLFVNQEVIITEKVDGGNCQLFQGKVYARTTSKEATHKSFSAIKQLYSQFSYMVPDEIAIFGENMFGIHSIEYDALESFFYMFGVMDYSNNNNGEASSDSTEDGRWWSWEQVEEYADQIGVPTVPVLFKGTFSSVQQIKDWMEKEMRKRSSAVGGRDGAEGFVIRTVHGFANKDFERCVAKFVRKGHIQTDEDWSRTWKSAKLVKK